MNNEVFEMCAVFTLFIVCMVTWYFAWVIPHDEFLFAVMDCMTDINDHTEAGYNICAERVGG